MRVIVGSSAAPELFGRTSSDLDIWTDEDIKDIHKGWDVSTMPTDILKEIPTKDGKATLDALYTIKCSHLGWDILWQKHKLDVLTLEHNGAKIVLSLYKKLINYWKEFHGNKDYLSLYKTKGDFFNDFVEYRYDHDYLHELVAYPDKPVYTKYLKDGEQVAIDHGRFMDMSFEDQIKMFREEIVVIACERWIIPGHTGSWVKAYMWSLRKTVTALTKNWATEFIILNLKHFVTPKYEMFNHILKTLSEGGEVMSNVDLTVFEELKKKLKTRDSLEFIVHNLCEGRTWFDSVADLDIPYEQYSDSVSDVLEEVGYKFLQQEGGGEGGAEHCYGIFKLKGKIYKAEYSYYSYDGHEYDYILDTLKEVKPVEKTITVYE